MYVLAPFVGTGTHDDPFRVEGADAIIDLRPDATQVDGWAVAHVPSPKDVPADAVRLTQSRRAATARDETVPDEARRKMADRLGVQPTTEPFGRMVLSLLADGETGVTVKVMSDGVLRVFCAGLLAEVAVPAGGAAVSDTFDRPDSTTSLGTADSGQVWSAKNGTWGIDTNQAYSPGGSGSRIAVVESGEADIAGEVSFPTVAVSNTVHAFALRVLDVDNHWWYGYSTFASGFELRKVVGGTGTIVGSAAGQNGNGMTLSVEADGSSITAKRSDNDTALITATDTTHSTATQHGLLLFSSVTQGELQQRLENFEVAELALAATVTPATIGVIVGVTAAEGRNATIKRDVVKAAVAVPTPIAGLTSPATVTPPTIAAVASLPASSVQGGAGVQPAVATAAAAVPSATASASSAVTPAAVGASVDLPTASMRADATVQPSTVAVAAAVPSAAPDAGSVVQPHETVGVSVAVPVTQAAVGSTVTPEQVVASSALASVSVSASVSVQQVEVDAGLPQSAVATGWVASPATIPVSVAAPNAEASASAKVGPTSAAAVVSVPMVSVEVVVSARPGPVTAAAAVPAASTRVDWTIQPGTIQAGVSMPSSSASGSVKAAPDTLEATTQMPPASTVAASTATPGTIAAVLAVPTATASAGAVVAPDAVALAVDLPATDIESSVTTTPETITSAVAIDPVSVGVSLSPEPIAVSVVMPQASFDRGAIVDVIDLAGSRMLIVRLDAHRDKIEESLELRLGDMT